MYIIYYEYIINQNHMGARLNVKMPSYQYGDPHIKDKTVSRPSYV